MSDRRAFVRSAAAFLAASPFASRLLWPRRQESAFRWHQLREDVWMVEKGGGNTTVIRERDGAVVIDLKLGGVGIALRREIEARVGPIQAVIITHHHGDHSAGYHAFRPIRGFIHRNGVPRVRNELVATGKVAGNRKQFVDQTFDFLDREFEFARTPATEADIEAFAAWVVDAAAEDAAPGELVDGRSEPQLGRTTFRLIYPGNAHTDNDLFVVDRRRRLVVTGDLLFHGYHPFVDVAAGASIGGWEKAIDVMTGEMKSDWLVVPGHGAPTDRDGLLTQRAYFETVRSVVAEAKNAGKSREEIKALPNRFPNHGFGTMWPVNLGIAFDEHQG